MTDFAVRNKIEEVAKQLKDLNEVAARVAIALERIADTAEIPDAEVELIELKEK